FLETFLNDLRYSCRALRKNPGFTTVAVLTLALGVAVNATMFSLVSAFLLRRPPGRDPDRVAVISSVNPAHVFNADTSLISAPNYLAWREANHVFAEMAAADYSRTVNLSFLNSPAEAGQATSSSQPEALWAAGVSLNYFRVLGVEPQIGRTFTSGE